MNQSQIFFQLSVYRFRTVFRYYWEILHGRILVIGIAALLLTPPDALSAYLHVWTEIGHLEPLGFRHSLVIFITELLNLGVLIVHAKRQSTPALEYFEMSLPIGGMVRRLVSCIESFLIQIPSLFLLLIAILGEFAAFGRGIQLSEFTAVFLLFALLMLLNHVGISCLQNLSALSIFHRFFGRKTVLDLGVDWLSGWKFKKSLIFARNRKRQCIASIFILFVLSALGWSIALIPAPEQPKNFLWTFIFGLSLMVLTPISFALDEFDAQIELLLTTVPTAVAGQQSVNMRILFALTLPFVCELVLWPIVAWSRGGTAILYLFYSSLLMGSAYLLRRSSKRWFIPGFMIVSLLISWLAEQIRL